MIEERIPFGIKALDKMISGGLLRGSANLLEGAPGTGKTTLAMQYIYNGITMHNEPGLIITFEEFRSSIIMTQCSSAGISRNWKRKESSR